MTMQWKKGRGKLGFLDPLIGSWTVQTDSERGPFTCTRSFTKVLGEKFVELRVHWEARATTRP